VGAASAVARPIEVVIGAACHGGWIGRLDLRLVSEYATDEVDFAYAFFMNCYNLKDWLKRSARAGKAWRSRVENLIEPDSAVGLSVCADICNGVKHFELRRKDREDKTWIGARSYDPSSPSGSSLSPFVLANGRTYHLIDLAAMCMQEWEQFLLSENLLTETAGTTAARGMVARS
jgi:hypothetical protein